MSRVGLGLMLLVVWLMLWGSASPANVLSGVVVVALLFVVVPTSRPLWPNGRLHPLGLMRLAGYFIVNVLWSNIVLSWAILSPRAQLHKGVVHVRMRTGDLGIVTMVTNLTALTPGSMVVQINHDPSNSVLWVHYLTPGDPEKVARNVVALERRCIEAFGTAEQIEAVRSGAPSPGIRPSTASDEEGGTS